MDSPPALPPSHPMKTLRKQWLEALVSAYYVLAVLFLGERAGKNAKKIECRGLLGKGELGQHPRRCPAPTCPAGGSQDWLG